MKVEFHPEAEDEMIESARFYEQRSEGLGTDFLAAVNETIHRIQQFPHAGSIERAGIRRRLVSGFPFTVLYEKQQSGSSLGPSCISTDGQVIGRSVSVAELSAAASNIPKGPGANSSRPDACSETAPFVTLRRQFLAR